MFDSMLCEEMITEELGRFAGSRLRFSSSLPSFSTSSSSKFPRRIAKKRDSTIKFPAVKTQILNTAEPQFVFSMPVNITSFQFSPLLALTTLVSLDSTLVIKSFIWSVIILNYRSFVPMSLLACLGLNKSTERVSDL